jgi:hypothetical protein
MSVVEVKVVGSAFTLSDSVVICGFLSEQATIARTQKQSIQWCPRICPLLFKWHHYKQFALRCIGEQSPKLTENDFRQRTPSEQPKLSRDRQVRPRGSSCNMRIDRETRPTHRDSHGRKHQDGCFRFTRTGVFRFACLEGQGSPRMEPERRCKSGTDGGPMATSFVSSPLLYLKDFRFCQNNQDHLISPVPSDKSHVSGR